MRVFGFVMQESAAKFIMADIMYAFRHVTSEYAWIDLGTWEKKLLKLPHEKRRGEIDSLIAKIHDFNPDFIVSYGIEAFSPLFSEIIEDETRPFFSYIRPIPFLCFFFDFGLPFTDRVPAEKIPLIHNMQGHQFFFLCWDKDAIKIMNDKGITKCIYFPMGVNQNIYKRIEMDREELQEYQCDLCFIGGPTVERIKILEIIHNKNLRIYGYDEEQWCNSPLLKPHFCHTVFDQAELVRIYNGSLATVNITRAHGKSSLNMRAYEAMACGSLLLTDDKPDARELFVPDEEIIIYSNGEDLREKAEWVTKNRDEAMVIASRGMERVLEEHTYQRRIRGLMPQIERFVREYRLLEDIVMEVVNQNTSNAMKQIKSLLDGEQKPFNAYLSHYIMAKIFYATGEIDFAKQSLNKSLLENPHFIRSIKMKKDIEGMA